MPSTRFEKRARDFQSPESARAYAQAIRTEARNHSREARHHKTIARALMEKFNSFLKDLEALGIEVVIEPPPTNHRSPGGTSDTSTRSSASQ